MLLDLYGNVFVHCIVVTINVLMMNKHILVGALLASSNWLTSMQGFLSNSLTQEERLEWEKVIS